MMTAHGLKQMRLDQIKAKANRQKQLSDDLAGKAAAVRPVSRVARWVSSKAGVDPATAAAEPPPPAAAPAASDLRRPAVGGGAPSSNTPRGVAHPHRELQPQQPSQTAQARRVEEPARLPLPSRLRRVEEAFSALEASLLLCNLKRGEQPLFSLLQPQLTRATGHNFTPEVLSGILAAWPGAYELAAIWPAQRLRIGVSTTERQDWLLITPSPPEQHKAVGAAGRTTLRRAEMRRRLLHHVDEFHSEWLHRHAPGDAAQPLPLLAARRAWHPSFPLDECSTPQPSPLPELASRTRGAEAGATSQVRNNVCVYM